MQKKAKRPGRPPKPEEFRFESVTVRLPKDMIRGIDAECTRRADRPDRSRWLREMIADRLRSSSA